MFFGGFLFFLFFAATFALWIYALVSAIKVPHDSMYRAGNKLVWVLVIVFLHFVGAIVYLLVGKPAAGTTPPAG